jgi:predicted dehydrogenase
MRRREFMQVTATSLAGASLAARVAGRQEDEDMPQAERDPVRVGIVGCGPGTHGEVWARMLASPDGAHLGMIPAKVWDADADTARALAEECGAEAVATHLEAGEDVDGVLITELLPERYLELSRPFLDREMKVFYNRPFAGSIADAKEICRLAEDHGASVYSASALYHTAAGAAAREALAEWSPVRLFTMTGPTDHIVFYLPHAIAALMSVLGTGVRTVRTVSMARHGEHGELSSVPVVVYVEYAGGPRGTVQMAGPGVEWYAFVLDLLGQGGEEERIRFEVTYELLLREMAEFFRTGEEPIPHATLLEKTAIYYGALASADAGGERVELADLLG